MTLGHTPRAFVRLPFLSTLPRSDFWHCFAQNFASCLYLSLPHNGSRSMLVFPVARPFVCGCHSISTLPTARTIPDLPGSLTFLPHRVVRTHLGTTRWNPCAFASIVQARPFLVLGRPIHRWIAPFDYNPVVLLRPFRPHLAMSALPSGFLTVECELSPSLGCFRRFRLRARLGINLSALPSP